ncbi:sensor histidine kinase [Methylocella sp.]|uniref:sensor histidine kinase n=1 Tax=Methylocella sp. TaxID=1978226 RepID=UPI003784AB0C
MNELQRPLATPPGDAAPRRPGRTARPRPRFGLGARVLALNSVFVVVAAALFYLPALSNYRSYWLHNRLAAAYTATLVLEASPSAMTPPDLSRQLLDSVGARVIVLSSRGTKRILAASEPPLAVDAVYDLREQGFFGAPLDALETLLAPPGRVITVLGEAPRAGDALAITMDEAALKRGMNAYARRLIAITLVIAALVAVLATIAVNVMVLRPMRRLADNIADFGSDPENAQRIIAPSGATHEIGRAEEALAVMQESLVRELNHKKHLAALGLAVAKINHDMRNMLSSAQLLSDRLADVTDPLAQRIAPKLVATLDRAIRFCQATMTYGRAVDEPPKPRRILLRPLVEEAIENVRPQAPRVEIVNDAPGRLEICADPEQLFRVLVNLLRNGSEALQSAGPTPGWPARIVVRAFERLPAPAPPQGRRGRAAPPQGEDAARTVIEVSDTGPGVPPAAREKLFAPFFTADRAGGTGLGLVIAADLVRGHGGELTLAPPAPEGSGEPPGAKFVIVLPALAPDDAAQPPMREAGRVARYEKA